MGDPALYPFEVRRAFCLEMLAALPAAKVDSSKVNGPDYDHQSGEVAHLLLVCVHAHHRFVGPASIPAVRAAFGNPPTTVVALPCCSTFNPTKDIGRNPDTRFDDEAVSTPPRHLATL